MFYISKPTAKEIEELIENQSKLDFSYKPVGATKSHSKPEGFTINQHRKVLGTGKKKFDKAFGAVNLWQMYALGWTQTFPEKLPIEKDNVVVTMANHLGFWSLNPCRIIYVIDEETDKYRKFGFAFGTLPAHSEKGEEQFLIEFNKRTEEVFYEIYSYAKPHNPLAKIAFPYVWYLQKAFAEESYEAMLKYVNKD